MHCIPVKHSYSLYFNYRALNVIAECFFLLIFFLIGEVVYFILPLNQVILIKIQSGTGVETN